MKQFPGRRFMMIIFIDVVSYTRELDRVITQIVKKAVLFKFQCTLKLGSGSVQDPMESYQNEFRFICAGINIFWI